jgi:hypothetical protein
MDRTRAAVRLLNEYKLSEKEGSKGQKSATSSDDGSGASLKRLRDAVKPFLRDLGSFKAAQYQILACERLVNSPEEQQVGPGNGFNV